MTIQQVRQALGSWHITLKPDTPRDVIQQLEDFGHIAIVPGRINPKQYNDGLLTKARYVGPLRSRYRQADGTFDIKGVSMAFWLGDEDDKGDVFETAVDINAQTFANTIRALLPAGGAVIEGTLTHVDGTYTGKHQYETPRSAITYVTDTYSGTEGEPVEWRVNGDATLDAGPVSALYVTTPQAILVRKDPSRDLTIRGVRAAMSMDRDVEDYTTRVVLLAQGEGASIPTATADAPPTPFNDIHGNPVISTRLVSESETESGNAAARAQLELNRWQDPRYAVQINSNDYDVRGDFQVGDYVYAYDPDNGFIDEGNQRFYKGQVIHPISLRVIEMTWPVRANWTVAFRKNDGTWIDLSEYYKPETGATYIMVGDFLRTLAGFGNEHIGIRPNIGGPDSSIPAAPAFTGFSTGAYQSDISSTTRAAIRAQWNTPLNIDGSTVTDGDHYEIRYRVNMVIGYQISWDLLAGYARVLTDNFFRTPEIAGWGTPEIGDPWSIVAAPDNDEFYTDGTAGYIELSTVNVERVIIGGDAATDTANFMQFSADQLAVGSNINTYLFSRYTDNSNNYRLRVAVNTDETIQLRVEKVVAGVLTNVGAGFSNTDATFEADALYNVFFRNVGTALQAKIWREGDPVPVDWHLDETDASIAGPGTSGVRAILSSGNTSPLPVICRFTNVYSTNLVAASPYSWDDLGGWDAILSDPVSASPEWLTAFVGWGTNAFTITELTPGVTYELQIRGVDAAKPPNQGPWSASSFVTTTGDIFAPSTPAAPIVAGSTIAIQVVHSLGKSDGGTFNLEQDLDHLDVHIGGSDSFLPSDDNKIGELIANSSMINANAAAVGTFQIGQITEVHVKVVAVDRAGNRSNASPSATVTAELIEDQYISSLTATKITAGTISAWIVNAGRIATALLGQRVELEADGMTLYGIGNGRLAQLRADDRRLSFWEPVDAGEGSVYVNPVVELGFTTDLTRGMRVGDLFGDTKVLIGQIDPDGGFGSENYGIALENGSGTLVKLEDFIFGPQKGEISGIGTINSTTFGDLTDFIGPYVTNVSVGPLGRVMVTVTAYMEVPQGGLGIMGVEVIKLDPTTVIVRSPDDLDSLSIGGGTTSAPGVSVNGRASCLIFIEGLDAGTYEFVAKYRRLSPGGSACTFANRQIVVQPY